nr:MAG TPA: hypothetical protein [Crassvirales sp.]DAR56520.1 MAG TPA: hypothetical protein [Crassvirales sp.]
MKTVRKTRTLLIILKQQVENQSLHLNIFIL